MPRTTVALALLLMLGACSTQPPPREVGSVVPVVDPSALPEAAAPTAAPADAAPAKLKKPDCVVIEAANEGEGLRAEGKWLREHYPGFKRLGQGVSLPGEHVYDYIDIETETAEKLSVCFDITSFFGKF